VTTQSKSDLLFSIVFFVGGVSLLLLPDFDWPRLIMAFSSAVFAFIFFREFLRARKSTSAPPEDR
jgi:hypothetical protein